MPSTGRHRVLDHATPQTQTKQQGAETATAPATTSPAVTSSAAGVRRQAGDDRLARSLARAVLDRGGHQLQAPQLQRLEAPKHESAERHGLTSDAGGALDPSGLSSEEATAVYLGNWMRDLNQVFVPLAAKFLPADVIFALLTYMGAKKFGRAFTSEQFGYYIPAEHIDSPAGLTMQDDVLPGPPAIPGQAAVPGAVPRPDPYVTPQVSPEPSARAAGMPLFSADETGTMAYIRRTNEHVERRLELAARRGRNPEGMMHFGAALHAIEDLFAHSNWIEMALNRVLRDSPELLPQLKGADRHVFAYAQEQQVRPGEVRPVLMTGSFTGGDTKISIASEVVKFMSEPLPPPASPAEARAEQHLMRTMLVSLEGQLKRDRAFRDGIAGVLRDNGAPPLIADRVVKAPLVAIYDMSQFPWMPDFVRERLLNPIRAFMRNQLSSRVLQPTSRQLQAQGINATVADTSLVTFLREQQAAQARTLEQLHPAERKALEQAGRFTGKTAEQEHAKSREAAARHVAVLQATPERVIGGPTHSQVSKDHANSPFFALAFRLAAEAVRRMRLRMVAAWDEQAGRKTAPFDFSFGSFPAVDALPEAQRATAASNRQLYHERRGPRGQRERASLERGNRTVAEGGDVHVEDGHAAPRFVPYDIAAMRGDSADAIADAANGLRALVAAPGQAGKLATGVQHRLSSLGERAERLRHAEGLLGQAAAGGQAASSSLAADQLRKFAAELDVHASAVRASRTLDERAAANAGLRATRARVVSELRDRTPAAQRALALATMAIIDQQVADTTPAYTAEQRAVAEGRKDLAEHTGPRGAIPIAKAVWSDPARTTDPAWSGGQRGAALQALIVESRLLLNHPYESTWWVALVKDHVSRFPQQTLADIEARNAGYATLRKPGEQAEAHAH